MAEQKIKSVHFIQRYGVYNAAERAGFSVEEADRLIAAGVAIDPENPSVVGEDNAEAEAKNLGISVEELLAKRQADEEAEVKAKAEAEAKRLADEAEIAKQAEAASKAQEKADKAEAKKLGISVEELLAKRQADAEAEEKTKAEAEANA